MGVVVAVGTTYLMPDAMKVSMALNSTQKQLVKESTKILESMPVYDFFKDAAKDAYSLRFESASTRDPKVELAWDLSKEQIKAYVYDDDVAVEAHFSQEYTTFNTNFDNKTYGIVNKTLISDLNNCSYLDVTLDDNINLDLFQDYDAYQKEVQELTEDFVTAMMKALDVEELSRKGTLYIDGSREDTTAYEITMSSRNLQSVLDELVDGILASETVMEQWRQIMVVSVAEEYMYYDQEIDADQLIKEALVEMVDEVVREYNYIDDPYFVAHLYKGKLVAITNTDQDAGIQVGSVKNMLEEILIFDGGDEFRLSFAVDDDIFRMEMGDDWGEYVIEYDYQARRNNVSFRGSGYSESFTLDSTTKNYLTLEIQDEFTVEFGKNQLPSGWFDQDQNFERILEYSESQLEEMMYNLNF